VSVQNLFKPGGLAWRPDANEINAPEGVLLRADNMVPDEDGALSVRRGSRELYNFPAGTEDIHSLYTYEGSDGNTYRMMAADDQVYKNPGPGNHTAHWEVRIGEAAGFTMYTQFNYTGGSWEKDYAATGDVGPVPFTTLWEGPTGNDYIAGLVTTLEPVNFNVDFAGTGDIAFGDDHQQSFMARSTTKKKFDGKSFLNWGIPKPSAAATLSATAPSSLSLASFAQADSPAYSTGASPATLAYVTGADGTASGAAELTPGIANAVTFAQIYRTFASDQDFLDIGGLGGSDQDIFDITVRMEDPGHVKFITLLFRLDDPAVVPGAGGVEDQYQFVFYPKTGQVVEARDPVAEGQTVYEANITSSLSPVDPKDKPRENTPAEVKEIIAATGGQSTVADGTVTTPPAGEWVHFSVARGQFSRLGTTTGRDWSTVTQIALEIRKDDGYLGKVALDNLIVYSAGEGTLTGEYTVVYRWVRETDRYYELSPPSDPSTAILLYANQLKATISGATQTAADDQVTAVWVYVFGGFLDTYYRAATAVADPQLSTDLEVSISKNEITILTENERLEPYTDEPLDNIISIAGPWNGRLFTFTSEGYCYPSLQNTPNLFNTYQVIDLSNQGDPLWMVKTSSGIHCGCERDVIFLAGTGDEDSDRVVIDLYPHPLNLGTPPVDKATFVDGNSILYRATDGLIMLASQGLTHVPDDGMRLLWRGQTRHGVSALNTLTGRFRMTVDNKIMYVLAPEGATADEGTQVIYRLDLGKGQWSRMLFPNALLSIFNEPDGTLIAGTNDGKLLELEYGTGDANSVKPTVTLWTPFVDGGNPLVRKDSFDMQFHTDTNGNTATVNVYKDGAASSTAAYTFSTSIPQAYRIQAEDVGTFIRAQLRVTGTFDEFQLSSLNMTYRQRPEHMVYLDTGYLQGNDPSDVIWLQEVEVDANSPSDLEVLVYLDDRLYTTESVTVTANVRTVYRVPLPRGCKSRRPRIVVRTTAADGAGEIGFDPYFVRVRTRSSGNQAGAQYKTIWPVGQAA